jgi:hypothetical protein
MFFLILIYTHFFKNEHLMANVWAFSLIPLALIVTLRINAAYMTAQFIKLHNLYLSSIIFLVTLALSCN